MVVPVENSLKWVQHLVTWTITIWPSFCACLSNFSILELCFSFRSFHTFSYKFSIFFYWQNNIRLLIKQKIWYASIEDGLYSTKPKSKSMRRNLVTTVWVFAFNYTFRLQFTWLGINAFPDRFIIFLRSLKRLSKGMLKTLRLYVHRSIGIICNWNHFGARSNKYVI